MNTPQLAEAITQVTYHDPGGVLRIVSRGARLPADHELVKRHPESFLPAPATSEDIAAARQALRLARLAASAEAEPGRPQKRAIAPKYARARRPFVAPNGRALGYHELLEAAEASALGCPQEFDWLAEKPEPPAPLLGWPGVDPATMKAVR